MSLALYGFEFARVSLYGRGGVPGGRGRVKVPLGRYEKEKLTTSCCDGVPAFPLQVESCLFVR